MKASITTIIKRLKELRKDSGHTQESYAEAAGFSYKYYQAIEAGRKKRLQISTVDKLAAGFGLEAWELLHPKKPKVKKKRKG